MLRIMLVLFLALTLAACGDESSEPPAIDVDSIEAPAPAEPTLVDGTQVVEIEAGLTGYEPRTVRLDAGVPARLVFTRTVESDCSSQVKIPSFDIPATDLPLNEPVAVEFTPSEGGDFEFVCGMDMHRGSLLIQSQS